MLLAIAAATVYAALLMSLGRSMDAFYALILSWPLLIYEASPKGCLKPYFFYGLDFPVIFQVTGFPFLLVIFVGWARLALVWGREKITRLVRPEVWLFLAAGLISTFSTSHPGVGWASYAFRVVVPMMGLVLFTYYIRSWDDVKRLFQVASVTSSLIVLIGAYYTFYRSRGMESLVTQFREHTSGSEVVLGGANFAFSVGGMAIIVLGPMIALWYAAPKKREKALWLALGLLGIFFILFSFQRSYIPALVFILLPWMVAIRRFRIAGVLILSGLALAWIVMPDFFSFNNPLLSRWEGLSSVEHFQQETRFTIWRGSILMFLDHPWFGIGMGTWSMGRIQASYGILYWGIPVPHAHSALLQMATEMGIPGIIAWGAFLWRLLYSGMALVPYYRKNPEVQPWMLVIFGWVIGRIPAAFIGNFPFIDFDKPISIIVFLWFAVIVSMADKARMSMRRSAPLTEMEKQVRRAMSAGFHPIT